jgi:hypothetical protein
MDNETTTEAIIRIDRWMHAHRDEHTADKRLLASILDAVSAHQSNHHGRGSTLKQAGWVGGLTAILVAGAEALRILLG